MERTRGAGEAPAPSRAGVPPLASPHHHGLAGQPVLQQLLQDAQQHGPEGGRVQPPPCHRVGKNYVCQLLPVQLACEALGTGACASMSECGVAVCVCLSVAKCGSACVSLWRESGCPGMPTLLAFCVLPALGNH